MECPHCQFVVAPGEQAVDGGTCPNCERPYRSQPSPLNSDMAMRDMPEPGMDDSGGNPLQEGILGDYQHPSRRDESFASVQAASDDYDSVIGDHELAQQGVPFPKQCSYCDGSGTDPFEPPGWNVKNCPHCGGQGVITPEPKPDFEVTGVLPPEDGSVRAHNERDAMKNSGLFDDAVNTVTDNTPIGPAMNTAEDIAGGKNVVDSLGNGAMDVATSIVPGEHALLQGTGVEGWMQHHKWPLLGGAALAALAVPTGGADLAAAGGAAGAGEAAGAGAGAAGGEAAAEGAGAGAGAEGASGGGKLLSKAGIGGVMKNALMAHGAMQLGQGALNNVTQPLQPQFAQPQIQGDSFYSHTAADEELKSPGSRDNVGHDEDDDFDSKEHDDGDESKSLGVGSDINDIGGSDQGPDGFQQGSPGMEQMAMLFPKILEAILSGEDKSQDPELMDLHNKLDQESPGYLDHADDNEGHKIMMMIFKGKPGQEGKDQPHDPISDDDETDQLKAAALEAHTAIALNEFPGQAQGGSPGIAQPGKCANCGNTLDPSNGGCPQCGLRNPLHMPQPTNPDLNTPQQMAVAKVATETQGPVTDEQKALLSEFLIQQGREDEVPAMLLNPAEYADELAQVVGKDTPPTPPDDPTPPPSVPPQGADQGGMPMPGMGAPGGAGAGPMMAAIARYASSVDVAAKPCPKCKSHTTGYQNEHGDCLCHSCGHEYKGEELINLDKTADHSHPHNMDNEIGVPAADAQGQEDVEREQDTGHTWVDDGGDPLKVGQEYEMYSSNYDIPDIVRIEDVKPDAVDYTLTGEYGLEHRTEVSHEEAQLEGIHFVPSHEGHDQQDQNQGLEENMDDIGRPSPGMNQTDLSTPHIMSAEREASPFYFPEDKEDRSLTNGQYELPQNARGVGEGYDPLGEKMECPQCGQMIGHSELLAAGNRCPHCGFIDGGDQGNYQTYPPEVAGKARELFGYDDTPPEHYQASAEPTGPDWLADELRTAGAKFTPFEQRNFIDEQGMARNSEKLDLTGTHYEMDELDPNFLFGL